ncbi:MAG: phosphatase PAP2 family protein [Candidatus Aminicenantes bacterium]|nr:phosphatase PAP2 family protein [Candidatus Aminicenantes bacterium]
MNSFFKKFSIIDFLNFSCLAVVVVFYGLAFKRTPYKIAAPLAYLGLFLFMTLMIYLRSKNKFDRQQELLNFVYPAFFVFGIFETFFMTLSYFNSNRYDDLMVRIDRMLLGVDPTIWFQSWISPLATDFFYVLYFFYFPMPFFIVIWLYRKKMLRELGEAFFVFIFTYFGAYIAYFFVPVQGPRFFMENLHTVPLDGVFFTEPIRTLIDFFEPNKLDAFPSLHTTIVLMTLFLCFKHNKKMFRAFLPVSVGILISLIYCRYHYFIDMAAGAVWATFAYFVSTRLYSRFNPRCFPHFGGNKNGEQK